MHTILISSYANIKNWRSILFPLFPNGCQVIVDVDYEGGIPDYIIFDGGSDVTPIVYGEGNVSSRTSYIRDLHELGLFNIYRKYNVAFVGICRGSQFINCALGGTLFQHLTPGHTTFHTVDITKNTHLTQYIHDEKILVNSYHHQAVKNLGVGLQETLRHRNDGIIEGYESEETVEIWGKSVPKYKAIQSHPEYLEGAYKYSKPILKYLFSL